MSSARPWLVEEGEDLTDELVVVDHHVVVLRLPPAGLAAAAVLDVRAEVHVGGVEPQEERRVVGLRVAHEAQRLGQDLLVDGLHPFTGQRAGVLDALRSVAVRPRVDDAARAEGLAEVREVGLGRIVLVLGFLLRVEVVQVAEELVEAVHRRQELVPVAEVVLAELARGVPLRLERRGDGGVLGAQADVGAGEADLGETGSIRVLSGDERRPAGRAALLAVVVGEADTFGCDAVDVGSPISHQPIAVATQIADPDVVTPDDQDVGLAVGHGVSSRLRVRVRGNVAQARGRESVLRLLDEHRADRVANHVIGRRSHHGASQTAAAVRTQHDHVRRKRGRHVTDHPAGIAVLHQRLDVGKTQFRNRLVERDLRRVRVVPRPVRPSRRTTSRRPRNPFRSRASGRPPAPPSTERSDPAWRAGPGPGGSR